MLASVAMLIHKKAKIANYSLAPEREMMKHSLRELAPINWCNTVICAAFHWCDSFLHSDAKTNCEMLKR